MKKNINSEQVVAFREAGATIKDIALRVGCSERMVSYVLRKSGVSTAQRRTVIAKETLAAAWKELVPVSELSLRFGCSAATLTKMAKVYGLPRKLPPPRPIETDPTPAEIEERKAEIKRRHLEAKRREDPDTTRIRVWRESVTSGVA